MKIPIYIINQGNVSPIDFEPLLRWSDGVQALLVAQEIFRGRGSVPEEWCLVALLQDETKYLVAPETTLSRKDLGQIASFHWLRPDLVAKLESWQGSGAEGGSNYATAKPSRPTVTVSGKASGPAPGHDWRMPGLGLDLI